MLSYTNAYTPTTVNTISGLFFRYDALCRNIFECIQTILSLLRYSGRSANFDSFITLLSCIPK